MKGFLIRGFNTNKDYPVNIYRSILYTEGEHLFLKTKDGIFQLNGDNSSGGNINLDNYYTKLEMDSIIDNIQIEGYITVEDLSEYITNDKLIEEIAKLNQVDFNIDEYLKIEDLNNNVTSIVDQSIAQLIDGAPEAFDTLKEISDWINVDENKTFDLIEQVSLKADKSEIPSIEGLATETFVANAIPNLDNYYIKDEVDTLIDGVKVDLMINTTHADLLALVNNSGLTPGQQYRITDYVATVNTDVYINIEEVFDARARSNNHAFDIIVTADSVNKLNENARAIRHEGDTYFPLHTKFEEWQIKYTILNDSDHFDWAISEGKGVVYQLIDEFNNDLPYDFKSIQFRRNDVWIYTFGSTTDVSLEGILEGQGCFENKMKPMYSYLTEQDGAYGLNNNTFGDNCSLNTFDDNCFLNTFGEYCRLNTFENDVSLNTFRYGCIYNTFREGCHENTFESNCNKNTLGEACSSNTFGHNCDSNTFGNSCSGNSFGNSCYSNTFGNSCSGNSFGNSCDANTFENSCNLNDFGDNCQSNILGNSCASNTFENGCNLNTFESNCNKNTFGSDCNFNTFRSSCDANTFGNECGTNTFGVNCFSNTLGEACSSNTFGNSCHSNTLGEGYINYNISSYVLEINFISEITKFTTQPNNNVVNVIKTPSGVTFSQVIDATTTEAFDV